MSKKLQTQQNNLPNKKATNTILGGTVGNFVNDPQYEANKKIVTVDQEIVSIKNPITGKEAKVVLDRRGTTAQKLGALMLSPDSTQDQRDSMTAMYLFERGKESASFITDLMLYKGTHTKETRAFKSQIRFDFEMFADKLVLLFQDISSDIKESISVLPETKEHKAFYAFKDVKTPPELIYGIATRLHQASQMIAKQRKAITDARAAEKGYGIYIDKNGKPYTVLDNELEDVIKADKEALKEALKEKHD